MVAFNLLRGDKVRLTALTSQDVAVMARWWDDSYYLRNYAGDAAMPRSEEQLARRLDPGYTPTDAFRFAIRTLDADEPIGVLDIDGIGWNNRTSWFSIAIGDAANRGRGYGTEASELGLRFAFDELNLRRVSLTVFSYNQPAIAVYEKLGFVREGVYREFLERDGQFHDMYLYGLLRREWRNRDNGRA